MKPSRSVRCLRLGSDLFSLLPSSMRPQSTSRLTSEEIAFMNQHLSEAGEDAGFSHEDFNSDLDSIAASSEDGMPPEVAAAFEEFIANQG